MTEEIELLGQYAATRSETAFAALAERYVGLVYAAACRQGLDAHLAEDVTQAVFIVLAQKAAGVPTDRPLSAWLLKTTSYCAANARRARTARQTNERRAAEMARDQIDQLEHEAEWQGLAPLLDEGINRLRAQDRDALLLKFFERRSLRQVGEALGISEEAAGKRVSRAVEKLRDFFRRRGVAVSAVALSALLASPLTQAAPAGLVTAIAASAASSAPAAASGATLAKGAMLAMAAEKTKAAAVAALLILGVGGAAVAVKFAVAPPAPAKRQVTIAPAVPPSPAPQTRFSAWPIQFPDGASVEIVGISDESLQPTRWWTLDGSPVPVPPTDLPGPGFVRFPEQPRTRKVQVVLRFVGISPDAGRMIRLSPNRGASRTSTTDIGGLLTRHLVLVAEDQQKADLTIGLASAPWETETIYQAPNPLPSTRPASKNGTLRIIQVRDAGNGETLVEAERIFPLTPPARKATAPPDDGINTLRDEMLTATTAAGPVPARNVSHLGGGRCEYRFAVAASQIKSLNWSVRPYAILRIENVALMPGVTTEVRLTERPADPASLVSGK